MSRILVILALFGIACLILAEGRKRGRGRHDQEACNSDTDAKADACEKFFSSVKELIGTEQQKGKKPEKGSPQLQGGGKEEDLTSGKQLSYSPPMGMLWAGGRGGGKGGKKFEDLSSEKKVQ